MFLVFDNVYYINPHDNLYPRVRSRKNLTKQRDIKKKKKKSEKYMRIFTQMDNHALFCVLMFFCAVCFFIPTIRVSICILFKHC